MKQSTIEGYTNEKPLYNTTGFLAQALARRIAQWSVHNVALRFKPPSVGAVAVISPKLPPPEEALDPRLFEPGAMLYDRPLNFYIAINAAPEPFLINAGYLGAHFVYGAKQGYRELKRLISRSVEATDIGEPPLPELPVEPADAG